jgi:cbb3-type cytochrome oxidase subunit 3
MFTEKEGRALGLLQQNSGEIKYFEDIAAHFINKSHLEISTFSQLAYINLPANKSGPQEMTDALSELFEILIFIKKLEQVNIVFHIPYTALKDNTVKIGLESENVVHKTIADADLLIQIFQYASKKYVFIPVVKADKEVKEALPKTDFFSIALLFLLIVFIGFVAYHAHLERRKLQLEQDKISSLIENNEKGIMRLESNSKINNKARSSELGRIDGRLENLSRSLEKQEMTLENLEYSNNQELSNVRIIHLKLDSLIKHNKEVEYIIHP